MDDIDEVTWPLSEDGLRNVLNEEEDLLTEPQKRLWGMIKITPEKWRQTPYGDAGCGFWVVGLIGRQVIWYNDIEDGFDVSDYHEYGHISSYQASQMELTHILYGLMHRLEEP